MPYIHLLNVLSWDLWGETNTAFKCSELTGGATIDRWPWKQFILGKSQKIIIWNIIRNSWVMGVPPLKNYYQYHYLMTSWYLFLIFCKSGCISSVCSGSSYSNIIAKRSWASGTFLRVSWRDVSKSRTFCENQQNKLTYRYKQIYNSSR